MSVTVTPPPPIEVTVVGDAEVVVDVAVAPAIEVDVSAMGVPGPPGPTGGGLEHVQLLPMATWTITHDLGRRPGVALYVDSELVDTDVDATPTTVHITFPSPTSGVVILT